MHEVQRDAFWSPFHKQPRFNVCWEKAEQPEDFQESDLPPSSPKFAEMLPSLREPSVYEAGGINRLSDSQVVPSLETSMVLAVTRYSHMNTVGPSMNQFQSEDDPGVCKRLTYQDDFPDPFLNTTSLSSEQCQMHYETTEQTVEDLQIYLPPELSPTPLDKLYSTFPYTPEERLFQFPYLDENGDVNQHMDLINRRIKGQEVSEEIITNINCYSDQVSPQLFERNRFGNVEKLQNVPDLLFNIPDDNCNENDRTNVVLFRSSLFRKADTETKTTHPEQSDDLGLKLGNGQVDNCYSRKRQLVEKAPDQLNINNKHVIFLDENTRLSHNDVERQRRNEMKGRFDSLKSAIPEITGVDRSPKILVLRKAKDFINELHSEEERLDEEKIYERDRNRKLLQKLVNLTGGFK